MRSETVQKKRLPDAPGVYFFKKGKTILYIGKATSLRDRVRSYFSSDVIKTRGPAIVDMVTQATHITYTRTDSVLEALLLESSLIKKIQPRYNVKERDDKSYNSVIVTNETYPRVLLVRSRDIKEGTYTVPILKEYGPFPYAGQLREALKLIQKIFPFFDTYKPVDQLKDSDRRRVHLYVELGIYPDIFSGSVSKVAYRRTIRHICSFFEGKKKILVRSLEREMRAYAKQHAYEKAAQVKKTIFALQHINDVSVIGLAEGVFAHNSDGKSVRIESYDIAHTGGSETVGGVVVSENGILQKGAYKKFIIRTATRGDDYGALREVLQRRFQHAEWKLPHIIVVDGGEGQRSVAVSVLKQYKIEKDIIVVNVVKDQRHTAREVQGPTHIIEQYKDHIIALNVETHRFVLAFHRKRRGVLK